MLHHHLIIGLLALSVLTAAMAPAAAAVQESECAAVRAENARSDERVFFQAKGQLLPVRQNAAQLAQFIKGSPGRIRFVYLTKFQGDESPTLVSSIIRFQIANPEPFLAANPQYSKVYTYNNLRDVPLWVSFEDYQKFHSGEEIDHRLSEWFHVGPGLWGWRRNLFQSSQWELPRRLFLITGNRGTGEGVYSYLIALRGLNPEGSCFDTSFVLPPSLRQLSFVFRDLRAQAGQFLDPVEARVEFPQ